MERIVWGAGRRRNRNDILCSGCGALLAKLEAGFLSVRRSGLELLLSEAHGILRCHVPDCMKNNVLDHPRAKEVEPTTT